MFFTTFKPCHKRAILRPISDEQSALKRAYPSLASEPTSCSQMSHPSPRTGPVVLERITLTCLKTGLATGQYIYSTSTLLERLPTGSGHLLHRQILSEAREISIVRNISPVSFTFPLGTWKISQYTFLAIASERVHPAPEKGPTLSCPDFKQVQPHVLTRHAIQ